MQSSECRNDGRAGRLVHHLTQCAAWCGRTLLNLLLPPCCVNCQAELGAGHGELLFCDKCRAVLAPPLWRRCPHCGGSLPEGCPPADDCPSCRRYGLRFDTVVPLGIYEGELRHVVLKMKHSTGEALAINMARLLAHCRAEELTALKADCVVPIPMFWTRKLRRGINSAEVLAEFLARDLGLPCHRRALARVRNTMHQMELPPKKRKPSSNPSIGVRWGRN